MPQMNAIKCELDEFSSKERSQYLSSPFLFHIHIRNTEKHGLCKTAYLHGDSKDCSGIERRCNIMDKPVEKADSLAPRSCINVCGKKNMSHCFDWLNELHTVLLCP